MRVEEVMTRKHVELPRGEDPTTVPALVARLDRDETIRQTLNVPLDRLGRRGRLVHFRLELLDARRIVLKRRANFRLEVVDNDKVGEEWEDVFDFDQVC